MEKKNYRFRAAEIEAMKHNILTHCENEHTPDKHSNLSAWRLRLSISGTHCYTRDKRKRAAADRELALYEMLTDKDMPNFAPRATETPRTPTPTKKYHVTTYSYDSGEDAKQDAKTLKEATQYAEEWLRDTYYNHVRVYGPDGIIRKYIRGGNGKILCYPMNAPQPTETPQIPTEAAHVDSCAAEEEKSEERANLSKIVTLRKIAVDAWKGCRNVVWWKFYDDAPLVDLIVRDYYGEYQSAEYHTDTNKLVVVIGSEPIEFWLKEYNITESELQSLDDYLALRPNNIPQPPEPDEPTNVSAEPPKRGRA